MCEAHAFIIKDGTEEKLMENVDQLEVDGDEIKMTSIFGEQKNIKAKIKSYNGSDSRILLEAV